MLCSLAEVLRGFGGINAIESDFHLAIAIDEHDGGVTIAHAYTPARDNLRIEQR